MNTPAFSTAVALVTALALGACGEDKAPAGKAAPAGKTAPAGKAAATTAAAVDPATALAALAKVEVAVSGLGLRLDAPTGTVVTPARSAEDAARSAHLEVGEFMVNLTAVDEYSTPSFDKAKQVSGRDKLLASLEAKETPTGWVVLNHVESELHGGPRFELSTRTTVGGKRWDCGVSAKTRGLADLAVAACASLR